MIVRKGAEDEGSRYQFIYRRTSYPSLEAHTLQILQQYAERSATEEQDTRGTPTATDTPPNLPNPLPPSPCRVTAA